MKKMTCRELGGACDLEFEAETFEEMGKLSQAHGREMFEKQDKDHLEAMATMMKIMETPEAMQTWLMEKMAIFDKR